MGKNAVKNIAALYLSDKSVEPRLYRIPVKCEFCSIGIGESTYRYKNGPDGAEWIKFGHRYKKVYKYKGRIVDKDCYEYLNRVGKWQYEKRYPRY